MRADVPADRLRRLVRLSDALSDARTVEAATRAVASAMTHELEADTVAVMLLSADGRTYEIAASDGLHPQMADAWASFPSDAPVPATDAVRTRAVVHVDGVADRRRRYPVIGDDAPASETMVVAPMLVHREEVIGAVSLGFTPRRPVDEIDRAFIQAAADLCAQGVHRARLLEASERAAARQRFLADAAALLAADLDPDRTLRRVAEAAVGEVADVCAVCLHDDDGALRPVVAVHRDPAGQAVLDELALRQPVIRNEGLLAVARTGEVVHVPVVDRREAEEPAEDEAHLALIRALDATSAVVAPMRTRGRVIGILLLLRTGGAAPLLVDDRELVEQLASRSALAIDNARLYAEQVELVEHLQTALSSHKAIEQAKGVLVARWGVTPTEAFDRMRRHARSTRQRLEAVADAVVAGTDDLGAGSGRRPPRPASTSGRS